MLEGQSPFSLDAGERLSNADRRLRRAFQAMTTALFEAGAALVRTGEHPMHVFRLESGWAARERRLQDGRVAVLRLYLPGDLIGLDGCFGAEASETVVALTPTTCSAMPRGELAQMLERDAAIALGVAQLLDRERRDAERLVLRLGRCDAEERVAAFLLDVYERLRMSGLATDRSFRLPLTQQQIGSHLGLTVVHVNRMVRKLKAKGIAVVSRNAVVITDFAELRRLATWRTAPSQATAQIGAETTRHPALASGLLAEASTANS